MADHPPMLLLNLRDSGGAPVEAAVAGGRLHLNGWPAEGVRRLDCRGGRLLRGLTDHHLHLMASAAARDALDLAGCDIDGADFVARLRDAARRGPVRAIGLDGAERLDAALLDRIVADVPVRIQARTGGLWVLNRAALAELEPALGDLPPAFERGADGMPNGRAWRADACLRSRAGTTAPDLAALGAELARWGVTSVVDASVTTDDRQAGTIASAGLPQRLTLMSGGPLRDDPRWRTGPVKIVLDDHALPAIEAVAATIDRARATSRNVAVHCVTHAELAVALAAFSDRGAIAGDRIEHGSMIAAEAIEVIAELGLVVVSNPGFIAARGDRYRRQIPDAGQCDLYRLESLRRAGIALAAGSDAPYGPLDPWSIMRAACDRRTAAGAVIGAAEAVDPEVALSMYVEPAGAGSPDPRHGEAADICVLLPEMRPGIDLDPVALTMIGGSVVYSREVPADRRPLEKGST